MSQIDPFFALILSGRTTALAACPWLQHLGDLFTAGRLFGEVKASALLHFSRTAQKCADRGACQSTPRADAPDSQGRQRRKVQRSACEPHQNVYRTIYRADQGGDVLLAGKA